MTRYPKSSHNMWLTVRVPPDLRKLVEDNITKGLYLNASDFLRDAVREKLARDSNFLRDAVREKLARDSKMERTEKYNPRWPKCDWCANLPACESGTCDCCVDKCGCQACIGPYYEDVFPRAKYPKEWAERDRTTSIASALRDMTEPSQKRGTVK
jgi:Arc/MetJ-type ribon-helix-helix transcriptional regulator